MRTWLNPMYPSLAQISGTMHMTISELDKKAVMGF
jgi:hypothetical protein